MARLIKKGLDYFPLDVSFFQDIKIRKLIKYQGGKALSVYIYLLCYIYKESYYIHWDDELPFVISEATGYDEGYILEVIKCSLNIGLFSTDLYEKNKILTSKALQARYLKICKDAKRKFNIKEFNLIDSEEITINSEEITINSGFSTQSKEENTKKENTKKEYNIRKLKFSSTLTPFLETYGKEFLKNFEAYWTEPNKSKTKFRQELEKTWDLKRRLETWAKNDRNFKKPISKQNEQNELIYTGNR